MATTAEYHREWYKKNAGRRKELVRANQARVKKWLRDYKDTCECSECGEDHPACLDFHHIDPDTKYKEVTTMAHNANSIDKIKEEIAKCVVLCSNCHRKLHSGFDS